MTEDTAVAVQGDVIDTAEGSLAVKMATLKENEQIVKRNWKAATEKAGTVYRALTIIHTYNLWKLHTDEKGKRKYTAFDQYLFGEFGWTMTRVRALQVIKATRTEMIAAGELPASSAEPRKRTAPEVTSERAAKVTADQLQKALDAFSNRVDSIDAGDPDRAEVVRILDDAEQAIGTIITDLRDIVERTAAEAEADAEDEDATDDEEAAS